MLQHQRMFLSILALGALSTYYQQGLMVASAFSVVPFGVVVTKPICLGNNKRPRDARVASLSTFTAADEITEADVSSDANGAAVETTEINDEVEETEEKSQPQPKKTPIKRDRHTLFVGNLPFDATDKELREMFAEHAKVEFVNVPRNRNTNQARGFAFVDVSSPDEIQAAIQNINGIMVRGRTLRVTESLPRDEASKGAPPPSQKKFVEEGFKKIYVGNLPFDTNRDELLEYYSQWGEVKDIYVPLDPSGESRGFAFLTMDEESADRAIEASNGLEYGGRKLAVSVPLPPGEKFQRASRQNQNLSQRTKLYVGNLSFYTVADTLRELFEQYGKVHDCYMPEDPSTGGGRGFGFITMDPEDAQRAIVEADGTEVDGRLIRVNEAQAKKPYGMRSPRDEGEIEEEGDFDE